MGYFFPNGVGASLGDPLVTSYPLYATGDIWYVYSETGDDENDGREETQPLATLGEAVSSSAAGDMIVCLDGHEEELDDALTIDKRLIIVGAGQSSGKPTVKFTLNAEDKSLFSITGDGVQLRNLWFEESLAGTSSARISVGGTLFRMDGCYMELDGNDEEGGVDLTDTSGVYEIANTTFISTATGSPLPGPAVIVSDAAVRVVLDGVVFDGGTNGFAEGRAYEETSAVTQLIGNVTLMRGADMELNSSTGVYLVVPTATGGARVYWAAGG